MTLRSALGPLPLLLFLVPLLSSNTAIADGKFVWTASSIDILEPEQKALIVFEDGVQELTLSVKFEGAPEEFGWIVPLPAVPRLSEGSASLFEFLSQGTQIRQSDRSERGRYLHMADSEVVHVITSQTVGIFRAQVLEAGDGAALHRWLEANHYWLPEGAESVLDRYARDGWFFTALKIRPGAIDSTTTHQLRSGTVHPVRFRFRCEEPVYPLEISSLASDSSDVLLYVMADELLVPRVPSPGFWETSAYSSRKYVTLMRPFDPFGSSDATDSETTFAYLTDHLDRLRLSKHRARFAPGNMRDVTFVPYDPVPRLDHGDSTVRVEATIHLGVDRPPGADSLLARVLEQAPEGPEICAALWALGRVGGSGAEEVLVSHLVTGSPETQVEAVEALRYMGSTAGLDHLVRRLEIVESEDVEADYMQVVLQRACFDQLALVGDDSCRDALEVMARRHGGAIRWRQCADQPPSDTYGSRRTANRDCRDLRQPGRGIDPGVLAVAALAAGGDPIATHCIVDAIAVGGGVTTPASVEAVSRGSSTINDFPSAFWTGYGSLSPFYRPYWHSLQWMCELFRTHPSGRDRLLRGAAADPRVPLTGVILLLAGTDSLTDADADRLLDIWHETIARDDRFLEITDIMLSGWRRRSRTADTEAPRHTVRYDYEACGVAYALSRHQRVDELETLWQSLPPERPDLRAELVFAMARTKDRRFQTQIVDHVRTVWARNAGRDEFQCAVAAKLEGSAEHPVGDIETVGLDLPYRFRTIGDYLKGKPEALMELARDPSLPPHLQLHCIYLAGVRAYRVPEVLLELQELLDRFIDARTDGDPDLRLIAEDQRRVLRNTADRLGTGW